MNAVVAILFCAAAILALLEAFGVAARISLGWLGVACLAAAFTLPALDAVVSVS